MKMRNVKFIGCGILVLGMLLVGMPTKAQMMEWQSTSTMQGSGNYEAPVTEVGATTVPSEATTTYSPAKVSGGPRKSFGDNKDAGQTGDPNSPLGDALIPLMLCACAYLIIRARKRASKGERANS